MIKLNPLHQMEEFMFNLKVQSKGLERDSKKCTAESDKFKQKARLQMEKGNRDAATIYVQQAIEYQKQSAMYTKMSCNLLVLMDELKMQSVNKTTANLIAGLSKTLEKEINSEELIKSSKIMTQFNDLCEKMGVQIQVQINERLMNDQMLQLFKQFSNKISDIASVTFRPSYKINETGGYSTAQIPSYTDRILVAENQFNKQEMLCGDCDEMEVANATLKCYCHFCRKIHSQIIGKAKGGHRSLYKSYSDDKNQLQNQNFDEDAKLCKEYKCLEILGSDHLPIVCTVELAHQQSIHEVFCQNEK